MTASRDVQEQFYNQVTAMLDRVTPGWLTNDPDTTVAADAIRAISGAIEKGNALKSAFAVYRDDIETPLSKTMSLHYVGGGAPAENTASTLRAALGELEAKRSIINEMVSALEMSNSFDLVPRVKALVVESKARREKPITMREAVGALMREAEAMEEMRRLMSNAAATILLPRNADASVADLALALQQFLEAAKIASRDLNDGKGPYHGY